MKPTMKKTMMAVLAASVALGVAAPVLAQPTGPGMLPDPMGWMDGSAPMPRFDLKTFDGNGDGKVTLEEMQAERAAKLKAADADNDGKMSADELMAVDMAVAKSRIAVRVKDRIAAQDADGDGKLSAAEMALPPLPARMFARLDANADGAVTEDEFARMQERMADRMQDRRGDRGRRGGSDDHWFGFGRN